MTTSMTVMTKTSNIRRRPLPPKQYVAWDYENSHPPRDVLWHRFPSQTLIIYAEAVSDARE